ncbi:baculoviral IAP repeat-containing protein 3-like [Mercenaria mercenaria]|uniref:baculoviral IAP repeat-containing protein 3-like n=1 Tax=Mercenaria mercenaria TaxID=6596 RepID=UPI00234E541B|nr:baculoviral IAP repeat-containing protein 3-like [Mercenaria mercenaria]
MANLNAYFVDRVDNNIPNEILMKYEWNRFQSYSTFPIQSAQSAIRLARVGLYYFGEGEYVKCFYCGYTQDTWPADESIENNHVRMSPQCAFARGEDESNVPIPYQSTEVAQVNEVTENASNNTISDDTINSTEHPNYAGIAARKFSFASWPGRNQDFTDRLANAGFFYTVRLWLYKI